MSALFRHAAVVPGRKLAGATEAIVSGARPRGGHPAYHPWVCREAPSRSGEGLVEGQGEALIIDVREPQEFAAGHVPGAVNIPRGLVEFQIWKQVGFPAKPDTNRPVYLQCQNGNRASLAAQSLAELGFTNTTAVVMSFDEWQQAGHPLVK